MDIALNKLPGIGPARLKALEDAGIFSVRQLVEYLPRSYRNLSDRRPLASLKVGDEAAVSVRVSGGVNEHRSGRLLITKVYVEDDSDRMAVVWYNQPWLKRFCCMGGWRPSMAPSPWCARFLNRGTDWFRCINPFRG